MSLETNNQPEPDKEAGGFKAAGAFFWDLFKILVIALVIIIPFRMFVAEPFVVSGSSMVPNFHDRDYLIVDRLTYHFSPPQRGDVVVLKFPKDTSQFFIKRIIGLPGETVECVEGKVVILQKNDQQITLKEDYLPPNVPTQYCKPKQVLGSDEYFALGDNRTASSDSRVWGILPFDDIVGRVFVRVFPLGSAKIFHPVAYQ